MASKPPAVGRRRALTALALAATLPRAAQASPRMSVLTFNVLAPLWAAPRWYPERVDPALLDRTFRRGRITAFLRDAGRSRDIVCLQEVEAGEMGYYEQALGGGFAGAFASHDPAYWSNWLVPELPWVPNGNALFVRRAALAEFSFGDLSLGGTGNHAVMLSGVLAGSRRPLRAASVHLDADRNNGRRVEFQSLLAQWPLAAGSVDLIAGDINEDTISGSLGGEVKRAGFADVLAVVGNREATHPFSSSYNGATRWAIIDHVLARGATPRAGDVFDFGLWSLSDEVARIEANFRACGSDHFPVAAELSI
jgi:endonuclease/exonuclease/phosphatase family metal-dependent hydrolase